MPSLSSGFPFLPLFFWQPGKFPSAEQQPACKTIVLIASSYFKCLVSLPVCRSCFSPGKCEQNQVEQLKADFHLELSILDFVSNTSAPLFITSVLFCPDGSAQCLQTYQLGKNRLLCPQTCLDNKLKSGFLLLTCRDNRKAKLSLLFLLAW